MGKGWRLAFPPTRLGLQSTREAIKAEVKHEAHARASLIRLAGLARIALRWPTRPWPRPKTAVVGGGPAISRYTGAIPCSQVHATSGMLCYSSQWASSVGARWQDAARRNDFTGPSLSTAAPCNCRAVPGPAVLPPVISSQLRSRRCHANINNLAATGITELSGRPGHCSLPGNCSLPGTSAVLTHRNRRSKSHLREPRFGSGSTSFLFVHHVSVPRAQVFFSCF